MAEVAVQAAYRFTPNDIVTVDKLNLLGTPLVSLSIETPITDQNYLRNGNFYSSFWKTPAGISCPVGVETQNANYWTVNPNGAPVTSKRSTDVPDLYSLWSLEIDGAVGTTDCSLGQQINGDLSATLRRPCTFSGYIENNTGALLSPTLEIWTANIFNNFNTVTLQTTVNLQTIQNGAWAYVNTTVDLSLSTILNVANGLFIKVRVPSGTLSATTKRVNFSRLKIQQGEVATEFSDDPALFVQAPSVDSTMLQDGCIARPSLFLPNVIPAGAYQAGSIKSGDIANGTITAADIDGGTLLTTTTTGFNVPAASSNVAITVADGTKIPPAPAIIEIQGAGFYQVVSVATNVMTVTNLGVIGNAPPGTLINSGANVYTENAIIASLGYIPVNKNGDSGIGKLDVSVDTAVGSSSPLASGVIVEGLAANQANDSFFPSIGFNRPGGQSRAVGLSADGRLKTVDGAGLVGYLLDSVHQVDTNSIQDKAVTLQKLSDALVQLLISPGVIHLFGGPNIPAGWLVCDGSAISRTGYPALFTAIGTYWGSGDNVNTFNVPDLRGRTPIGYVNAPVGGITGRAFGSLGGEETHALNTGEMPNHNHVLNWSDPGHVHSFPQINHALVPYGTGTSSYDYLFTGNGVLYSNQTNLSTTGIQASVAANGGGATHNNMPPFAVCYFIIKY